MRGTLQEGDGRLASGEYTDRYRFSARRGQRVTIALNGNKLDPYLLLARPDGTSDANDDSRIDGEPSLNSRIDTVLAEDGDYVVTVTSYRPGETGDYELSIRPSAGHPRQIGVPGGRAGDRAAGRRLGLWRAGQQSAGDRCRCAGAL